MVQLPRVSAGSPVHQKLRADIESGLTSEFKINVEPLAERVRAAPPSCSSSPSWLYLQPHLKAAAAFCFNWRHSSLEQFELQLIIYHHESEVRRPNFQCKSVDFSFRSTNLCRNICAGPQNEGNSGFLIGWDCARSCLSLLL